MLRASPVQDRDDRTNRLANGSAGVQSRPKLSQWIPGMGATHRPAGGVTLFAGIHRGFAPLRVETTLFSMDFENQIIPVSLAGGVGATLTNRGTDPSPGGRTGRLGGQFGIPVLHAPPP